MPSAWRPGRGHPPPLRRRIGFSRTPAVAGSAPPAPCERARRGARRRRPAGRGPPSFFPRTTLVGSPQYLKELFGHRLVDHFVEHLAQTHADRLLAQSRLVHAGRLLGGTLHRPLLEHPPVARAHKTPEVTVSHAERLCLKEVPPNFQGRGSTFRHVLVPLGSNVSVSFWAIRRNQNPSNAFAERRRLGGLASQGDPSKDGGSVEPRSPTCAAPAISPALRARADRRPDHGRQLRPGDPRGPGGRGGPPAVLGAASS